MSAGSHTEPGGYTGQGRADLHLTVRGKALAPADSDAEGATGQFEISDTRSAREVADNIRTQGFEPVWKDWDRAILDAPAPAADIAAVA